MSTQIEHVVRIGPGDRVRLRPEGSPVYSAPQQRALEYVADVRRHVTHGEIDRPYGPGFGLERDVRRLRDAFADAAEIRDVGGLLFGILVGMVHRGELSASGLLALLGLRADVLAASGRRARRSGELARFAGFVAELLEQSAGLGGSGGWAVDAHEADPEHREAMTAVCARALARLDLLGIVPLPPPTSISGQGRASPGHRVPAATRDVAGRDVELRCQRVLRAMSGGPIPTTGPLGHETGLGDATQLVEQFIGPGLNVQTEVAEALEELLVQIVMAEVATIDDLASLMYFERDRAAAGAAVDPSADVLSVTAVLSVADRVGSSAGAARAVPHWSDLGREVAGVSVELAAWFAVCVVRMAAGGLIPPIPEPG